MSRRALAFTFVLSFALLNKQPAIAQGNLVDGAQAEVDRSERRIREVRVEIGNRYEKRLAELRVIYQKAADLENALAVRAEEQRVVAEAEHPLEGRHLVEEPRLLKEAQTELLSKQGEMVAQIVQESVPKLVELKKALTVAGKLDEATEVRGLIQRLQEANSPAQRLPNNAQVTAEEVAQAYQSARERADKMYRGPRLLVRGKVAGVRPDPAEPGAFTLVLFGGADGTLVDCAFSMAEYRVREERAGAAVVYVVARPTQIRHRFAYNEERWWTSLAVARAWRAPFGLVAALCQNVNTRWGSGNRFFSCLQRFGHKYLSHFT